MAAQSDIDIEPLFYLIVELRLVDFISVNLIINSNRILAYYKCRPSRYTNTYTGTTTPIGRE